MKGINRAIARQDRSFMKSKVNKTVEGIEKLRERKGVEESQESRESESGGRRVKERRELRESWSHIKTVEGVRVKKDMHIGRETSW